jgi:hypothetical protein
MKRQTLVPIFMVFALLGAFTAVKAQEENQSYPVSAQQLPSQATPQQLWSAEQLDNIVAPIALYPDPLLSQILVASTYPLEVVEASQWLQRNRNLRGQALLDAAKQQPWDPSIQALVAVPDALAKLNQDIRWTTDLGDAFLAQKTDVMSAVQRMRARAQANGRLSSTPQQVVTTQEEGGQQIVVIQPASPQVIYVPTYDPFYVWGPPVYGYYPPLYYPSFGFGFGIGFDLGFCFGGWGGWGLWGWGPNWFGHTVFVNNLFFDHYGFHHPYGGGHGGGFGGRSSWAHDPGHRMRVPYGNSHVAEQFGGGSIASRNSFQGGAGSRGVASPYANRAYGRSAGGAIGRDYRNSSPQSQRYQNPMRQGYQNAQPYRGESQTPRSQGRSQERYQAPQQYRSGSQQYQEGPRVVPFGNRSQQSYRTPEQYRSAPQAYRAAPQVQRSQSQPQTRYQSPQTFAPRIGSGSFGRSGGISSFGRAGGGSSIGRSGGISSFGRAGGGSSFGRSGSGSFSRGGGGGFSQGGGSRRR